MVHAGCGAQLQIRRLSLMLTTKGTTRIATAATTWIRECSFRTSRAFVLALLLSHLKVSEAGGEDQSDLDQNRKSHVQFSCHCSVTMPNALSHNEHVFTCRNKNSKHHPRRPWAVENVTHDGLALDNTQNARTYARMHTWTHAHT